MEILIQQGFNKFKMQDGVVLTNAYHIGRNGLKKENQGFLCYFQEYLFFHFEFYFIFKVNCNLIKDFII